VAEVRGALTGLVDQLRRQQGWTMDRLAEAAGMSEHALQRLLDAPGQTTASDAQLRALARALQVDAWVLERAAASPRENVDELLRIADRLSGGALGRLRRVVEDAIPDSLDDAVRMARSSVSPAHQVQLAHLITVYTRMAPADREFLLTLAARLLEGPLAGD
jgi:transcriptional regulator with XRE-family HTH domain